MFVQYQSNPRIALKSVQEQEDRQRRNERDRARLLQRQRSKWLRKRRQRDRARWLLKLLVKDKLLHSRKVPVNVPWGERNKITADEHQPARKVGWWTPEREKRGYSRWLVAGQELPSSQDVDPYDAHLARTFVPSTAQRLTEQVTIRCNVAVMVSYDSYYIYVNSVGTRFAESFSVNPIVL